MDTTTDTGTTLALLAPFFPYGLEVATQWADGSENVIGKVTGWHGGPQRCIQFSADETEYRTALHMLLPVLRSFADLCTPLEDGTVPAVEFAKLCLGDEVGWEKEYALYQPREDDSHFPDETVEVGGEDEWEPDNRISFTIYSDWTWYGYGRSENCTPAAAIDYLRSKHFAVGLQPNQFTRKTEETPLYEKHD